MNSTTLRFKIDCKDRFRFEKAKEIFSKIEKQIQLLNEGSTPETHISLSSTRSHHIINTTKGDKI